MLLLHGKSNLEQKALTNETQDDCAKTSSTTSGAQCQMLNEVLELSHLIGKLKVNAKEEVDEARKRFKDSRKRATDAFSNEALGIKDTIFATALRIVSQILERLDNPEIVITGCLSVLEKLHSLPAIQEIFNVYMNGGFKSLMNKDERAENVKSVMLINYVLFEYVSKFGCSYPFVLAWPTIDTADRSFNPILHWQELSTKTFLGDELTQHSSGLKLTEAIRSFVCVAINGHEEIVFGGYHSSGSVTVISKTGERKEVELPATYNGYKIVSQRIGGVAVDKNNNIYVVSWLEIIRVVNGSPYVLSIRDYLYVLYILDDNYNVKQECKLDFLKAISSFDNVKIAINNNNDIIVKLGDSDVFACDEKGHLKHKFEYWQRPSLSISNKNEMMIASYDDRAVHIYSEEGNLKSTINLPEGHWIRRLAFHFAFSKMIVLTYVKKKESYFLLCYAEEGELETTTYFCEKADDGMPEITSHPSGSFAVLTRKCITLI